MKRTSCLTALADLKGSGLSANVTFLFITSTSLSAGANLS